MTSPPDIFYLSNKKIVGILLLGLCVFPMVLMALDVLIYPYFLENSDVEDYSVWRDAVTIGLFVPLGFNLISAPVLFFVLKYAIHRRWIYVYHSIIGGIGAALIFRILLGGPPITGSLIDECLVTSAIGSVQGLFVYLAARILAPEVYRL